MFFNVPVSSWAFACPAQNAAVSARPITRKYFIVLLPLLDGFGNACINRAGIECNFRPPYDPERRGWTPFQARGPGTSPKYPKKASMHPKGPLVTGRQKYSTGASCDRRGME